MSFHGANIPWRQEQDDALVVLLNSGAIYREIAGTLNERFGTTLTRNAIAGRVKRLGLSAPAVVHDPQEVAAKREAKKQRRNAKRRAQYEPSSKLRVVMPPREQTELRCAAIDPLNVTLMDLEPHHCRWPYGDGPILFCGHQQFAGSSYCAAHFFLSIGPGTVSEQSAHRVSRRQLEGAR